MPVPKEKANGEQSFNILLTEVRKLSNEVDVQRNALHNIAYRLSVIEGNTPIPQHQFQPPEQYQSEPQYQPPQPIQKPIRTAWGDEPVNEPKKEDIKKPKKTINKKVLIIGVCIIAGLWILYLINGIAQGRQIILPF